MTERGKLIVIDGIDGSGKATQTKLLLEKLNFTGRETATMDFPRYHDNFFGKMIRQYLNGEFGEPTKVNPYLASVLYAADRWESSFTINQWISENKIVVIDRYYTSNLIHQGTKLSREALDDFILWEQAMEFKTFNIPRPDAVLFLHVNADTAMDLIAKRGEGYDGHDTIEHLRAAEQTCLYLAEKLGWDTISCSSKDQLSSPQQISELIWEKISQKLP